MRPSVRFEVFKRDGFTCAYCNRKPPDVTLEADHIIPIAEGGDDALDNLITACFDCNRGKGAGLLDDRAPVPTDLAERADAIRERELQLRAYHKARAEQTERLDAQLDEVWRHWFDLYRSDKMDRRHIPWESTLRRYIDLLGPLDVMQAMSIAHERFYYPGSRAVRYFVGICKNMAAER